jgi:hypothetical protein
MKSLSEELQSGQDRLLEPESFKWLLKNWNQNFEKLTIAERRQFYRSLIGTIEVFPKQLRIRYHWPLGFAASQLAKSRLGLFEKPFSRAWSSYILSNGGHA